jgi:hypothetical protein
MNIVLKWYDENGDQIEHSFPATNEVCSRCEGHGTHLNPSIGEHAYSAEEFAEAFDDDESREQYFKRGGIYDVTCEECGGKNVVAVVDESRLSTEQKKLYAEYEEYQDEAYRIRAEDRYTQRMENGGYD